MSLSPGDRIDRYEVIELLGAGGMGEVYRARDPKLARPVALKILHVDSGVGTDGPARLLREARAAAALTHANVLAIYDVGEVQEPEALRGLPYIAMELVIGKTLRTFIGDAGISLEKRLAWLREVASALAAAHLVGIVHRDVKPENVMIRDDGAVKVLDFGIARRTATGDATSAYAQTMSAASVPTLTGPGAVVGTPFYMAPEQLRGEALDGRTDQFAWGVTAYMLMTGESPWRASPSQPLAVISQILSSDPIPPRELDPRVPVTAADTILRALAKDPNGRFASMEDVIAALDARPGSTEVIAVSTPEPSARSSQSGTHETAMTAPHWTRRLARHAIGAAVAVAALSALLAVYRHRAAVAPGTDASAGPLANVECTSNLACVEAHGGAAWHCHSTRHACVELASPECKVYAEPHDAEAADVVWFGGMFPLTSDPGLIREVRATDLARQDFARALGPSASRAGLLHARPIGLVACDEGGDVARAAKHLAEDVEVPAVLGFRSAEKAMTAISSSMLPNRVLSFVTLSDAPALTKIPEPAGDPRLVWRTAMDREDLARPLARLVSDVLEPAARAKRHPGDAAPFKVATVVSKGVDHERIEAFFGALRFNDRSALENGTNFRQFIFDEGDAAAQSAETVSGLLGFAPDVIVFAGAGFDAAVLSPLEARWTRRPRPVYVAFSVLGDAGFARFAGRDPERRHRFYAATHLGTTMPNAQLVLRYNLAYPAEPVVRSESPQASYDAFYLLAYATYSLGDAPISGPALSGALARLLPPGRPLDVGPAQIFEAFDALRSGGKIDLNGAMGSLDFDTTTGEAPIDDAIVCLGVDEHGGAGALVDSGLVYDARAGKLVGSLRCP